MKPRYFSLITPSRWFTAEAQDGSFVKLREELKTHKHFRKIFNFSNTNEVFDKVEIAGGVNYFLYEEKFNGNVLFVSVLNGERTESYRPLFEEDLDIIISDSNAYKILERIRQKGFKPMMDLTTGRDAFGISGKKEKVESISQATPFDDALELRCAHEEIRYISRGEATKSIEIIDKWKVFTSKGNGGAGTLGDGKPVMIIGKAYIGTPGSVCTDSLLPFGNFDTKEEALNLQKYMQTKFFRYCVGILKTSQNLYQIVYKFVPQQDFTNDGDIDWSQSLSDIDNQLYIKYGLEPSEISYIESIIRPMV